MPDLDVVDRALESLTRDLAHSPAPGASAAMATVRKRRRTRVGAVALATLVVVGGGYAAQPLLSPEDGVAANGDSARFDRDALANATSGWITDWEDWEENSPWGGGGFGAASCSSITRDTPAPDAATSGTSRFVSRSGASAVVLVQRFSDAARATSAQELSQPAPDTCGTTTTIDVDGVAVRHDSMPPEGDSANGMWLGDVWSVTIGADRAELQVVNDHGPASAGAAAAVAESLVAGLRDGWTQSGQDPVLSVPEGTGQLPEWPESDVADALAGWRSASKVSASSTPNTPCLATTLDSSGITGSSGGTPRGITFQVAGFDDETTGPDKVTAMLAELRACTDAGMAVETLPNGVHVATYDTGGEEGRGAIWFAASRYRAGLIAVDRADRPMPMGAKEDVADALWTALRLPWE